MEMIQKEITIYDIAKVLQISPSTVSRGLNDHVAIQKNTKKRILEAAKSMGYQRNMFASSLRASRTNTIGVIVPRINSYFMSAVISGMEKVANDSGYMLIISQSQESTRQEGAMVKTMFDSRVDGLLVSLASDTVSLDHFDKIFIKRIPLIFFDRVVSHPKCSSVVIDNAQAGYDATAHLIDQGCKRIILINGNPNRNVYADRMKGYQQALADRGLVFDPSWVITNGLDQQSGKDAASQILKMNPLPDGIFACNDTSAIACLTELRQAGIKVPEQIAVVGFNDDPVSRVIQPNLTTIGYHGYEMGEISMSNLINVIHKQSTGNVKTITLRHELIVRQSSQHLMTSRD